MAQDQDEEKLLRSVALQNATAVLLARERAEQGLIEARLRISNILESITDGFYALDHEWRFTYINRRGEETLNPMRSTAGTLLGKNHWEEFPQTLNTEIEANYRRTVRDKVTVEFDTFIPSIKQWLEVRVYPSDGGLSVYFRDITQRRVAQEALRGSEQRFRAIFHQAAVGMAIANLDGRFEQVNARFADITGYDKGELIGMSFMDFTHPDDKPRTAENVRRLKAQDVENFVHEKRYIRKDGRIVWALVTVTLLKDATGRPEKFVGVVEDVTQRKDAEEIRQRLAAVVESSDDAIISMGLNTIIATWNQGAERTFGYTAGEVIGKSITILIPKDHENEEPQILSRLVKGERIDHYETVRARKDGSLVDVSLTVSPIYNSAGEIVGASKISREITERKRAEAALRAAQEELKRHAERLEEVVAERTAKLSETIQELEAFSYSVSHDMRSPLRAMQGYADALLEDYSSKLDPVGQDYLKRIRRASSRMDLLIQDVLAYSRVAKGDIFLKEVNIEAIIRDVLQTYPDLQDAADVVVEGPIPPAIGHDAYLTQIVSNLLNNAVKFVAPGKRPRVRIRGAVDGEVVRVTFEDNGIGIAKEHQEQIFQIFGRVYSDKKFEGTGIGLAIVKKAAERMGGMVTVESEIGKGSRFHVMLKARR